ncbi:AAA family ATPase [Clostridium chromiireducens]|uniref:AAA family ATPase n=1 Tax=Clostridium chromiireducens TaxID=225345 RepID=UPI003AF78DDA
MNRCSACGCDLIKHHILETKVINPMKNGSRIIAPSCDQCGTPITVENVLTNISSMQKVILISGTAGAGKSTIGQYIENKYNYIFIDGDAVSKKLNYMMKTAPTIKRDEYICHTETINTMLITLGLGYNVVVGYVFNIKDTEKYKNYLSEYNINPVFRVLVPNRDICITRDKERSCWTAGVEFVDKWYLEQELYKDININICIDNSLETVEETVKRHFVNFL